MPDQGYVQALQDRLSGLRESISGLDDQVRRLFEEIQAKQAQAGHIIKLLEIEGVGVDAALVNGIQKAAVADRAYEKLKALREAGPIHYRELARLLMSDGTVIPGQDPAANLLAHISRDGRFVRIKRGTYGLSEWGVGAGVKKRRKTARKRRSRKTRSTA